MKKSKRDSITRAEYHQLAGLLLLAHRHNVALAYIEEAGRSIVQELEHDGSEITAGLGGGHFGDAIYCGTEMPDVDSLLRMIGLRVDDDAQTMTWRTIETAPRDGTKVLLFWKQRPPADVGWYAIDERPPHRAAREGFRAHGDGCIPPEQPTHWQPLPAPPEKEEK